MNEPILLAIVGVFILALFWLFHRLWELRFWKEQYFALYDRHLDLHADYHAVLMSVPHWSSEEAEEDCEDSEDGQ